MKQLFSSQQCFGENKNNRAVTFDLCMPSSTQIINSIRSELNEYNQNSHHEPIKHIYIATDFDNETLWIDLHRNIPDMTVIAPTITIKPDGTQTRHQSSHFITDIYLMSYSNLFIGNCISSFTAFVSRYRLYNLHFHTTTRFFVFNQFVNELHDEL